MPTTLFLTVRLNKFEHGQGAPVQRGGATPCTIPTDWRTDTTENITFTTPLAGGKYLSVTTPDGTTKKLRTLGEVTSTPSLV